MFVSRWRTRGVPSTTWKFYFGVSPLSSVILRAVFYYFLVLLNKSLFLFQAASCLPNCRSTLSRKMKMTIWSIFWNSEQYVQLWLHGVFCLFFQTMQQFYVCCNVPLLVSVSKLAFHWCRFAWEKMPRRRATWWRWRPWTTKEKLSPCPLPTFTSTVCPWYIVHLDSLSTCDGVSGVMCLSVVFLFCFFPVGEPGRIWAKSPSDDQAKGWNRTGHCQRPTSHR